MSATRECYAVGKDVTIPLFNRSRIDEPVVKRDTGMASFFLGGQTFGFIRDEWGRGKDYYYDDRMKEIIDILDDVIMQKLFLE